MPVIVTITGSLSKFLILEVSYFLPFLGAGGKSITQRKPM